MHFWEPRLQADVAVASTVEVLSDFMRFLVRLPHSSGVSLAELGVLSALTRNGAVRISDLAQSQDMTQPGMTQLITRMERAGLVGRESSHHDRRVVLVQLTEAGHRLYRQRDDERVERFTALHEQLDEEDRERLSDALPVLARLIEIEEHTRNGHGL